MSWPIGCDRLGAPGFDRNEGIAVFEADRGHQPRHLGIAGGQVVGDARLRLDRHRGRIGAQRGERREHLAQGIDVLAAPGGLRRHPRIGAGKAAQQAVGRNFLGGVGVVAAPAVDDGVQADGIVARRLARQAGEIHVVAEFSIEHRLLERVGVVEYRQDDRQRALHIRFGISVILDGAHVEIAAVAATGEVELRHAFGQSVQLRVGAGLLQRHDLVVLKVGLVGDQDAVKAPRPGRRQGELGLGFEGAAPLAEARRRRCRRCG